MYVKCTACGIEVSEHSKKVDNRYYVRDVKLAYATLLRDGGWVGYKDYVSSLSGHRVDEKTLYMHYKFVYNI